MPPNRVSAVGAVLIATAMLVATPVSATDSSNQEKLVAELDALRQDSIAVARETQQHQGRLAPLDRKVVLLGQDAAARRRGLEESRVEQAQLLGALERLARHPPDQMPPQPGTPLDQARSRILLAATVPALRAKARALAGEIEATAALRARLSGGQDELIELRDTLARDRERLAEISARRAELVRQLLPDTDKGASQPANAGEPDLAQLIARADAAAERREKTLLARARAGLSREKAEALTPALADPTRPHDLRSFDAAEGAMLLPVSGTVMVPLDKPADSKALSRGLTVTSLPGAVVVTPFDGKIVYAGPFHPYELVLIIRHTDGYHSLLAGLGRADIAVGQWVLGGEPVGVMPDAAEPSSSGVIYFELRRDGRPVDPQPWLAKRDESERDDAATEQKVGDQKVRE